MSNTIEMELIVFREDGERLLVGADLSDEGFWIARAELVDARFGKTAPFGFPVVKAKISRNLVAVAFDEGSTDPFLPPARQAG